ncbi:MAG: hypothetical protein D6732_11285 [Methanobacteriota archaeon]|nr:MAG: hypothetical protein D6732_11285 [Euryarchaeota archaeon]
MISEESKYCFGLACQDHLGGREATNQKNEDGCNISMEILFQKGFGWSGDRKYWEDIVHESSIKKPNHSSTKNTT